MNITIAEEGWRFVLTCIQRYQGEGCFLILFAAALFYTGISSRGVKLCEKEDNLSILSAQKAMAGWTIPYVIVLALTVFNILIMRYVVVLLKLEDEYYRFLWLLPVTVLIGYAATHFTVRWQSRIARTAALAGLTAVIVFTGKTVLARGFTLAENLYKVPDEVIQICEVIHEDSGAENPKVITEFDLAVLVNQYDPSVSLEISYGDVPTLRDVEADRNGQDWDRWLTSRLTVMNVVMDHDFSVPVWDFVAAMDYTDASYLVAQKEAMFDAYYSEARCVPVKSTENYVIYRYYNSVLPMPDE